MLQLYILGFVYDLPRLAFKITYFISYLLLFSREVSYRGFRSVRKNPNFLELIYVRYIVSSKSV